MWRQWGGGALGGGNIYQKWLYFGLMEKEQQQSLQLKGEGGREEGDALHSLLLPRNLHGITFNLLRSRGVLEDVGCLRVQKHHILFTVTALIHQKVVHTRAPILQIIMIIKQMGVQNELWLYSRLKRLLDSLGLPTSSVKRKRGKGTQI